MSPLDVALLVAKAFETCGVGYFLGGSMASSFQGHPRLTNDLDFVANLAQGELIPLKVALGADFDLDEVALADAIARKRSWNIFHVPTVTRIDLFIWGDGDFDMKEFSRRRAFEVLPGQSLVLKSPEDTVLRVQGERLDVGYLSRWASQLDIAQLLERAQMAASGQSGI